MKSGGKRDLAESYVITTKKKHLQNIFYNITKCAGMRGMPTYPKSAPMNSTYQNLDFAAIWFGAKSRIRYSGGFLHVSDGSFLPTTRYSLSFKIIKTKRLKNQF